MIGIPIAPAILVFLRAIQQQIVIGGHYLAADVTPFAIAAAEVASVLWVVSAGWVSIPYVGIGGAIGVTSAMWAHRRFKK